MSHGSGQGFAVVDSYVGARMGIDLAGLRVGEPAVISSEFRLQREQSYGYVRALWWSWFADGRVAVSAPPGAADEVREIISPVANPEEMFAPALAEQLQRPVDAALADAGLGPVDRIIQDVHFACSPSDLRRHCCGDCRRLVDESIPPAEGLRLPTHCFPDGVAYGVVVDGEVVSAAFAHQTGVMSDRIADLGIDTAAAQRRRGYAKTAVSALVEHFTRDGGGSLYGCRPDNHPSIATARSVGFRPYATTLILSAPAPDLS